MLQRVSDNMNSAEYTKDVLTELLKVPSRLASRSTHHMTLMHYGPSPVPTSEAFMAAKPQQPNHNNQTPQPNHNDNHNNETATTKHNNNNNNQMQQQNNSN
eukprot:TRINITY_DN3348_c0_g1_i1.p1 TRINITY_DN3348_c0_g1~~TRINITY_DN3348_c0_g1_i1.p1  ORF type:complete len:101 (+),score=29.26 TRINITY_DN3348_c0_g1_i1:137-439(+)